MLEVTRTTIEALLDAGINRADFSVQTKQHNDITEITLYMSLERQIALADKLGETFAVDICCDGSEDKPLYMLVNVAGQPQFPNRPYKPFCDLVYTAGVTRRYDGLTKKTAAPDPDAEASPEPPAFILIDSNNKTLAQSDDRAELERIKQEIKTADEYNRVDRVLTIIPRSPAPELDDDMRQLVDKYIKGLDDLPAPIDFRQRARRAEARKSIADLIERYPDVLGPLADLAQALTGDGLDPETDEVILLHNEPFS